MVEWLPDVRRVSIVVLAVVMAAQVAARADELPALRSDAFTDDAWFAYRMIVPEKAQIEFELFQRSSDWRFMSLQYWLVDGDGVATTEVFGWGRAGLTADLFVAPPGSDPVRARVSPPRPLPSGFGLFFYPPGAGAYTVVAVIGIDGSIDASATLRASAGVELAAAAMGEAFLRTEPDFPGVLLQASIGDVRIRRGAGSRSETIAHRFFGRFEASGGGVRLGYEGPDGSDAGGSFYSFDGRSAGAYRFDILSQTTIQNVGRHDPGTTHVLGADVLLP